MTRRRDRQHRITRGAIIKDIARRTGIPQREIYAVVKAFVEVVGDEVVSGTGTVAIRGFGVWERVWVRSFKLPDLRTGEQVRLPPTYRVRFRAARGVRDRLRALKRREGEER